jgi:prepilin-type processing-associated H-X9-DG protein
MQQYIMDYDHVLPFLTAGDASNPGAVGGLWFDLFPYTKNVQIYQCPLAGTSQAPNTVTPANGILVPYSGYWANGVLFQKMSDAGPQIPSSIENCPDPSKIVAIYDSSAAVGRAEAANSPLFYMKPTTRPYDTYGSCYYATKWLSMGEYGYGYVTYPHNNGCNVAFLDGHVDWRKADVYNGAVNNMTEYGLTPDTPWTALNHYLW